MSGCPDLAEELTPEWCTHVMRDAGVLPDGGSVASVDCEQLDVRGYTSRLFRLRLQYRPDGPEGPPVAIAKLPSAELWNRTLGFHLGMFENELRFYEELSSDVPVRVPAYYGGACDLDGQRFALLMEDVSGGRQVDQTVGCSVEDAHAALGELARLQAAWWGGERFDASPWIAPFTKNAVSVAMGYDMACDGFHASYDDAVPSGVVAAVDALRGRIDALAAAMCDGPQTFVHGDFRVDNLVFDGDGAPPLVFDWQAISRGGGVVDAAQLITLGLRSEDRRDHEADLLRTYVAGLAEGGVVIS
jgi:hypothetical protein